MSALAVALFGSALMATPAIAAPVVMGNVSITPKDPEGDAAYWSVDAQFRERLQSEATALGKMPARLIRLSQPDMAVRTYAATIYDYNLEAGFRIELDVNGNEITRQRLDEQPLPSDEEFEEAAGILRNLPEYKEGFDSGALTATKPLPPMTVSEDGRRLINVAIQSIDLADRTSGINEIPAVEMATGKVVHFSAGAPATARADRGGSCGIASTNCSYATASGSARVYSVSWPAVNPKWTFDVTRPYFSSPEPNAGGIELTNVKFNGRLVFVRAHLPVLNVKYDGNACGPYRDWMDSENCFQATGSDAFPGIRVCTAAPQTMCEAGNDNGNFRGVAIYDEGDSLWLTSEFDAGWYRYFSEWRLYADGTIKPIFAFNATTSSCVCNRHDHHAYWRFDFAPDGTYNSTTDTVTGSATQVSRGGPGSLWSDISKEEILTRPSTNFVNDWIRIRNPNTGFGFIVQPSANDLGSVYNPTFAKADSWILKYAANQITDGAVCCGGSDQDIDIDAWANSEDLSGGRLSFWYQAGYVHDIDPGPFEPCYFVGPTLTMIDGGGTSTPTATPTTTATATSTPTPSPTPTATPTATPVGSSCSSPALAIPDGDNTGITSDIVINSTQILSDLNLGLNIAHTFVGDLEVTLTHVETGTSAIVLNRPGSGNCGNPDINVTLDDEASGAANTTCNATSPAIGGTLRPAAVLSTFDGQSFGGTWRLKVRDLGAQDEGVLTSWCLIPTATANQTPSQPGGEIVLHVKVNPLSVDPEGTAVTYKYDWQSTGGDTRTVHGPVSALEDTLAQGTNGATFNAGEVWTVTVTPYDAANQAGPAIVGSFTIGSGPSVVFNGWAAQ